MKFSAYKMKKQKNGKNAAISLSLSRAFEFLCCKKYVHSFLRILKNNQSTVLAIWYDDCYALFSLHSVSVCVPSNIFEYSHILFLYVTHFLSTLHSIRFSILQLLGKSKWKVSIKNCDMIKKATRVRERENRMFLVIIT